MAGENIWCSPAEKHQDELQWQYISAAHIHFLNPKKHKCYSLQYLCEKKITVCLSEFWSSYQRSTESWLDHSRSHWPITARQWWGRGADIVKTVLTILPHLNCKSIRVDAGSTQGIGGVGATKQKYLFRKKSADVAAKILRRLLEYWVTEHNIWLDTF